MSDYGLIYKYSIKVFPFPTEQKDWDKSTEEQRQEWLILAKQADTERLENAKKVGDLWKQIEANIDLIYGNRTNYKGKPIDNMSKLGDKIKKYLNNNTNSPFSHFERDFFAKTWKRLDDALSKRLEENRLHLNQQKKEQSKREDEFARIVKLTEIAVRNQLDTELVYDPYELLENLLGKNKYLRLATEMENTRHDWTDGFDSVRYALNSFKVENDTDKAIKQDIEECLSSEDIDGRVFRDTTWNYSKLYELADKTLVSDVRTVSELMRAS